MYVKNWEEFEIAAEQMYLESPDKCRYSMKYIHSKNQLLLKLTDNVKCVQYKTEAMPDLKKIERFAGNLMGHMASKE